jgi:hypothetical protein
MKYLSELSIDSLLSIKRSIEEELNLRKEYIKDRYKNLSDKELKSLFRSYNRQLDDKLPMKSYYSIEREIDAIEELIEERKKIT